MEFLIEHWYLIPLVFGVGILTGILAGIFGIGGGVIIVPMMVLLGNDIKVAIGISIMQMIFSSVYGSYLNYKKKNLDFKSGLYVGLGGIIGASFSGLVVKSVASDILMGIFLVFIVYSIIKLFYANAYGGESKITGGLGQKIFMVVCGIFVGVFAISLGIGGGMMISPLFAYYLGYSSKKIIPISLFFVIFSSVSGFTSLALNGFVEYRQGIIVGIASLIGVQIGIWILSKIDAKKHKIALLGMYVIVFSIMLKELLWG